MPPKAWKREGRSTQRTVLRKARSSPTPHAGEAAPRRGRRSLGAQTAHCPRLRGASRLPPTERAPAHGRRKTPSPGPHLAPRVPGGPHLRPPSAPTLPEVRGARPGLPRTSRPSTSFLTLRLAEEAEPLFNAQKPTYLSPCQGGEKRGKAAALGEAV